VGFCKIVKVIKLILRNVAIVYRQKLTSYTYNMPLPYAQNKVHIYKWMNNNRERYNELCKIRNKRRRTYQSQAKIFRLILIDLI